MNVNYENADQSGTGNRLDHLDKSFRYHVNFKDPVVNKKYRLARFGMGIGLKIDFNRDMSVFLVEQELDDMFVEIIEEIRSKNPFNDDAYYWINVSNADGITRFCLGNTAIRNYDHSELTRMIFKICQSDQEFVFRKFKLDVFLYDQGSGAGKPRRMNRNVAPQQEAEDNSRCFTNIKNKGRE